MITEQLLQELEEKAKAAQKGSFALQKRHDTLHCSGGVKLCYGTDVNHENGMHVAFFHAHSTAEFFLAASPSMILELIQHIRKLETEIARVSGERSDFGVIGYFQGRSDARDKVRMIEAEANYLAKSLSEKYDPWRRDVETWRKIAREALEHD